MIEWLQYIYAICTAAEPPSGWRAIAFTANLATAVAYFWIPAVMAMVFARWREELPYRRLWLGFVLFITACGLSHVIHALHLLGSQTPYSWTDLIVLTATAAISLVTAGGFTYLLPRIMTLTSPAASRRRMEAAVESATADLRAALEHQRLLLLEVHHRVKNNLQVVASLVNLHVRRQRGVAPNAYRDLRDRIEAMAMVYGQLQEIGSASFRALPYVKSLASSLEAAWGYPPGAVDVGGDDFEVSLDHATSFSLIVHEVLTNALEHAFPAGDPGRIDVRLKADGGGRTITISDSGKGIDGEAEEGIGRSLVEALAIQLGGRVSWESHKPRGTTFTLEF